jgi:4-hydroxy-tetrahydrodipicolinate reductase
MRLQLLLMQLLLCVLPGMEMGASCRLTAWVVEDSSGKVEITCIGDTMDIVSPDGLSLWYKEHGDEVKRLCTEGGKTLFWSSNFSLGVSIFSAVNKYLAKIMNQFPAYDVTMSETHHIHKMDAPSGTAITLAEGILENLDRKDKWIEGTFQAPDGTVSGSTECAANELPISSIREGEVPGIHSIRYDSEADSITITHDAKNRRGFALGAVLAAEYTAKHEGALGMSDLFPFLKD